MTGYNYPSYTRHIFLLHLRRLEYTLPVLVDFDQVVLSIGEFFFIL